MTIMFHRQIILEDHQDPVPLFSEFDGYLKQCGKHNLRVVTQKCDGTYVKIDFEFQFDWVDYYNHKLNRRKPHKFIFSVTTGFVGQKVLDFCNFLSYRLSQEYIDYDDADGNNRFIGMINDNVLDLFVVHVTEKTENNFLKCNHDADAIIMLENL